ncbi:MAG: hypothetical protein F9K29_06360 [Hyphomicrobiaceae bacterium]|nr:MAG: hypothetical protein F9K29_06360 [Hyphomicrobiaceae bacterium]
MPTAGMTIETQGARLKVTSPSGLTYEASTSASDGVLEDFFAAYDSSFVLANEKEGFAGFAECLALNEGAGYEALRARYGPFREFVVVVRNAGGAVVGGLNFIAFPLAEPDSRQHSLSLNLSYIFVPPSQRQRGVFRKLVAELPGLALALFAQTNPQDVPQEWRASPRAPMVYIFIEQNDPYRMTPQDYARDTQATGLDQLARIALWARQGARIVDFAYVQPALTADQQADRSLVYAVLGTEAPSLHPSLLRQHLERFFGISVLKGRDPEGDAEAHQQLAQLAALEAAGARVALLKMIDPARLPKPGGLEGAERASTLRDLLAPL